MPACSATREANFIMAEPALTLECRPLQARLGLMRVDQR